MKDLPALAKGKRWTRPALGEAANRLEGLLAVLSRSLGAFLRAICVVVLIATPSLLLPDVPHDTTQVVVLIALFGGLITLIEYASLYPALMEFRNAPPFNRVRFISLFLSVFLLSIAFRGLYDPTTLTRFVSVVGLLVGHVIDFPYSPVRLMIYLLPESATAEHVTLMRAAAGIGYLVSLLMLAIFLIVLRLNRWPNRSEQFNFWTNLPTFDPTMGGDVVTRLTRDARFNIMLGFLMPFLTPVIAKAASGFFDSGVMESPQTMIWMMAFWAFLPASMFMRGIAMNRIAEMIEDQRTHGARAIQAGLQAA